MNKEDKPIQASVMIDLLIQDLYILKRDAVKFDKGNDSAGQRVRKQLYAMKHKIEEFRKEIQRTRYYREAWDVHFGRKTYIDGLEAKERKYGSVAHVATIQITSCWKA